MGVAKSQGSTAPSADDKVQQIRLYAKDCRKRAMQKAPGYFQLTKLKSSVKKHFFRDLFANLFNVAYAPFYVVMADLAFWFDELGWSNPKHWQRKMPLHIRTSVQKEIEEFLQQEIFDCQGVGRDFQNEVAKTLKAYNARRNEKSDLNLSFVSLFIGFFFFRNHDFSLTQLTHKIAQYWANKEASSDFFLGKGIGSAVYSVFPKEPGFWQLFFTGTIVLLGFALVVYAIGALMFALQIQFNVYQKRIHALIEKVEKELLTKI